MSDIAQPSRDSKDGPSAPSDEGGSPNPSEGTPAPRAPVLPSGANPAPAGNVGPAKKRSPVSFKWKTIRKIATVSPVLIVGLTAAAWFAAKPSGTLHLGLVPSIVVDAEKKSLAESLFSRAYAALDDAERYHKILSFADITNTHDVAVPPQAGPREPSLRSLISELTVDAKGEVGDTSFVARFDLVELLIQSYRWIGAIDYDLIIGDLDTVQCPDGSDGCWRVVARYSPSDRFATESIGTPDELIRDLAVAMLRGAARNRGQEWKETAGKKGDLPFLDADAVPMSMKALEATAKGTDILRQGEQHIECLGDPSACFVRAREYLEHGRRYTDKPNPAADFGLALLELDAAFSDARKLTSELDVETHLKLANLHAARALQSKFVLSFVKRNDVLTNFKLLRLEGLAPGGELIDLAQQFSCALADYRRANWKECVTKIDGNLDAVPQPLKPYLEAALFDSRLSKMAPTDGQFFAEIAILKKRMSSFNTSDVDDAKHLFMLRRIFIKHACGRRDVIDDEEFDRFVRDTADNAPDRNWRKEAWILAANCRQHQTYPLPSQLEQTLSTVGGMPDIKERRRFELLVSAYWLRQGDMDTALEFAIRALELPWTRAYVKNSPEFAQMIRSAQHMNAFYQRSFDLRHDDGTAEFSDFGNCKSGSNGR